MTDAERALLDLCHGGEFAAWINAGVEMPLAALREYEEACRVARPLTAPQVRARSSDEA